MPTFEKNDKFIVASSSLEEIMYDPDDLEQLIADGDIFVDEEDEFVEVTVTKVFQVETTPTLKEVK